MKPIFLIGFMACGKTTLGKRIAKRLNYKFIDLDTYIEQKHQISVSEIFHNSNENIFREYEKEAILEIINEKELLIKLIKHLIFEDRVNEKL